MNYGAFASSKLVAEGRFDEAAARATEELAGCPDDPEILFNRGQALVGLGRLAEAVEDYAAAAAMDASTSTLDPAALDDELFFALRQMATAEKADPARAALILNRYLELLPEGRHQGDVGTWLDHVRGVEAVWVRETA